MLSRAITALLASTILLQVSAVPAPQAEPTREGLALLKFSDEEEPVWYSLVEKYELEAKHVKFVDVTATWEGHEESVAKVQALQQNSRLLAYPPISKQAVVAPIISRLSTTSLTNFLSTLTAFNNRHYRSTTGASASDSIFNTVSSIASGRSDITVAQVTHSGFNQKSITAKFAGTSPSNPVVIFGAHMDSTAGSTSGRAPGADDDGSGTVTLIETLRVLVAAGFRPTSPLEFHWYAGEEGGLLGSAQIARSYATAGRQVNAMVNFDMTAYTAPGSTPRITFVTDRTNAALTTYLRTVVTAYCSITSASTTCGYGCSDHASWTTQGYPSAFPFESTFSGSNPRIHSSGDTTSVSGFSFTQILEFAKLAVGTAVELAA